MSDRTSNNSVTVTKWPSESRYRQGLFLLFVLSLAHLFWQITAVANPLNHIYSDMNGYVERGWKLANNMPLSHFDAFYPTGTSVLYGAFFRALGFATGLQTIVYAQLFLIAAANLLLALSTRLLFNSRRLALLAMLGASLYWPFVSQASFFMAEPLFMFCLMLAFFLYCCGLDPQSWQNRGNRFFRRHGTALCIGMLLGYASLVKGQGLAVIAAVVATTFLARHTRSIRWTALSIGLGAVFPLGLQCMVHSANLGKPSFFLSANDAYNAYLGQSRHEAIGCLDVDGGVFFIFHNNNAGLNYKFLEPTILKASILNRSYFKKLTRDLWRDNFGQQFIRSIHNLIELVEINPHWPQRDVERMRHLGVSSQNYSLFFLVLPALCTAIGSLYCRRYRFQTLLCLSPLVFLAIIIAVTMGQPRYLVPFLYFLFPLAAVFYHDLGQVFSRTASGAVKNE